MIPGRRDRRDGWPNGADICTNDRVKAGNRIAQVGKMKAVDQSMLHLELYDKSATGPLTEQSTTRSKKRKSDGVPFFRRMDLIDPTPLLNQWKTHLPQA